MAALSSSVCSATESDAVATYFNGHAEKVNQMTSATLQSTHSVHFIAITT